MPSTSPCSTVIAGGDATAFWIDAATSSTPASFAATAVTRAVCSSAATPPATASATDLASGCVATPTTSSCASWPDSTASPSPAGMTTTASYEPDSTAACTLCGSATAENAMPSPPEPTRPFAICVEISERSASAIPMVTLSEKPDPNAAPTTSAMTTGANSAWMRIDRSRKDRRKPSAAINHVLRHISRAALSPSDSRRRLRDRAVRHRLRSPRVGGPGRTARPVRSDPDRWR